MGKPPDDDDDDVIRDTQPIEKRYSFPGSREPRGMNWAKIALNMGQTHAKPAATPAFRDAIGKAEYEELVSFFEIFFEVHEL